jgi:hypothetical protein
VQSHEPDRVRQADQISGQLLLHTTTHLSNTTHVPQDVPVQTSTQDLSGEPEIVIEPKPEWKCRLAKTLIPTPKKEGKKTPGKKTKSRRTTKKQTNKEKKTKYIELLQGDGNERTRIQVKVSC